jgi:hypothetical protein
VLSDTALVHQSLPIRPVFGLYEFISTPTLLDAGVAASAAPTLPISKPTVTAAAVRPASSLRIFGVLSVPRPGSGSRRVEEAVRCGTASSRVGQLTGSTQMLR